MHHAVKYVTPLLAAGAAAVTIVAAPSASVAPRSIKTCVQVGPGAKCHVEVRNFLPTIDHHSADDLPYVLGGD